MCELELNKEYTYKDICNTLGWRYSKANNSFKKRQIEAIESSYEFYHPLDSHKRVKKSYVFTKKIKDIEITDNRTDISYNTFQVLVFNMVKSELVSNKINSIYDNYIYVNSKIIYDSFAFNPYSIINKLKNNKELNQYSVELGIDSYTINIFYNIILDTCRSRIFKRLNNYTGKCVTKCIIGKASKYSNTYDVFPNMFLEVWNDTEFLCMNNDSNNILRCYGGNKYKAIVNNIINMFTKGFEIYNANKVNKIYIGDSKFNSIDDIDINAADVVKAKKVVSDSIIKAVNENINNRINNPDKYSVVLDDNQKNVLARYLECFNSLFDNGILVSGNSSDLNYQKD